MRARTWIGFLILGALSAFAGQWPVVQPLHEERTFAETDKDGGDTPLVIFVRNRARIPVYRLECHNGDYEGSSGINYSGDFQCALFALQGGVRASWNLLATNEQAGQRSDWLNRGRMTSGQIWGECGEKADYGRVRHFRLRAMQITFEFKDLEWFPSTEYNQHQLQKFTFSVTFVPDQAARAQRQSR